MRVLVLGATGMLGHEVVSVLGQDHDVTGSVRDVERARGHGLACELVAFDVLADAPDALLEATQPDVVVNAIGAIKQLPEGQDPRWAIRLNALLPHDLAHLCRTAGARLVHVSTDCVFSGGLEAPALYRESDAPDATDVYGRSKLLGEVDGPGCLTLRTSIIGRELERQSGLLEWLLSQRGQAVGGFTHAIFSGLSTLELARVIGMVIAEHGDLDGLWHVASQPIDKFALLHLLDAAFALGCDVLPKDEPVLNRGLDAQRFRERTGYEPRPWAELADEYAGERV